MTDQTTKNMIGVLQAVAEYAHQRRWSAPQARKVARMNIACVMTESNGHMYANTGVPISKRLPHDAMGQDHDSVGMFQQRVGLDGSNRYGWGTAAQAMDIRHSTRAFVSRLESKGLTPLNLRPGTQAYNGHVLADLYDRIQDVQVSWYDGTGGRVFAANYRANSTRSWVFLLRYWNTKTMTAKSKVSYL